ncbi:MAG TPA: hypothetical protein VHD33_02470 [Legionellaceae bacterium]|nr:hypothetical protein [Legionellaceae bacterium]
MVHCGGRAALWLAVFVSPVLINLPEIILHFDEYQTPDHRALSKLARSYID